VATQHYAAQDLEDAQDSRPLDFDTFTPTHDPSLTLPTSRPSAATGYNVPSFPPLPPSEPVDAQQALQNAMGAWYWAGYWSGVYHTLNRSPGGEQEAGLVPADSGSGEDETSD